MRDELVSVSGVLVLSAGHDEEGTGRDGGEYVLDVEPSRESRYHFGHLDAGALGDLSAVGGEGAARAPELNSFVDRHQEQGRVPSIGVTECPDSAIADGGSCEQG
jgi:hypothetical protein